MERDFGVICWCTHSDTEAGTDASNTNMAQSIGFSHTARRFKSPTVASSSGAPAAAASASRIGRRGLGRRRRPRPGAGSVCPMVAGAYIGGARITSAPWTDARTGWLRLAGRDEHSFSQRRFLLNWP